MTRRVFIEGQVQGVGMRPRVALLAEEFGVAGWVRNVGSNVEIVASAEERALDAFVAALAARRPGGAEIARMLVEDAPAQRFDGFTILDSRGGEVAALPPDFPVCPDCAREMNDPADRRWRHPFISCAACGPRYSILERAPYDRCNTSMDDFAMCPDCLREYTDPGDRRYHAQTISCPQCGPVLLYDGAGGRAQREDALARAIAALLGGGIVAVKGVGGYHLACSPHDEAALLRLRKLKGREQKPFAVLFRDMGAVLRRCEASQAEERLLLSPARPIVLLKSRGEGFAPSLNAGGLLTGAFLPYTPLQMLLLEQCEELVMTSANKTGKPEIHEDCQMLGMLADPALSGVLHHGRRIVTRLDDSVMKIGSLGTQFIRRSRGYAPRPVAVGGIRPGGEADVLAYGSDLKSAFCLLRGGEAHMSQYFGDIGEREVLRAYEANLRHMQALFSFTPALAACDPHPGYHSARLARTSGLPLVAVQHHHAHVASVMAEHDLTGPVIGVAFDGTGYGEDGAVWGGEFLLCEGGQYVRSAHLGYVALAGGDGVAVDGRKAALCYRAHAGLSAPPFEGSGLLASALRQGVNTVRYSGMGRLFDAAASMLGLCHLNGYEGQCAVALENAAHRAEARGISPRDMDFAILEAGEGWEIDVTPVILALDAAGPEDAFAAALGFHRAICRMVTAVCGSIRNRAGVGTVALSGGSFQNALLLDGCMKGLREANFAVYTNNQVPCNDGGLALGQAYAAAAGRAED